MIRRHVVERSSEAGSLERCFLDALQRIVDGEPVSKECVLRLAKGAIRPNRLLVAAEAGASRTHISGKRPRLPRVAIAIIAAQRWFDAGRSSPEIEAEMARHDEEMVLRRKNQSLRRRNTEAIRQRDAAFTSAASSVMLTLALEKLLRRSDVDVQAARRAAEALRIE